ncbi:MAG: hydroxyquinol 1,2-dioxygenase [Acetobacteraceae bacterium]|nr:hydroxyquinol 1,2-dioxygenase [Acetobacteraceae bacterium]
MQDLTVTSVTDAALAQMAGTPDPRLREVMASLVRHLHDFARDVNLTPDEWIKAITFLTRVGQACTPARQEFILLSDVLGLSALVNLMHDKMATEIGTESSLLGPFYQQNAPSYQLGDSIAVEAKGPEIQLYGRVTDMAGRPVPDALIQVWQTDSEGIYDLQRHHGAQHETRGNFRTDPDGRFWFRTITPLGYEIPMDGPVGELIRAQRRHGCRPAHIHFLIGAPGHRELVTALYLGHDQYIDSDTVFGVSRSLVVTPEPDEHAPIPGIPAIHYDFRLGVEESGGSNRVGADPSQILAAE